jgi:hypothetical protein
MTGLLSSSKRPTGKETWYDDPPRSLEQEVPMRRAKIDHEMTAPDGTVYSADTEVEVTEEGDIEGVKHALATFPDGKEWAVPDEHLRKWITPEGYWLKSLHDIDAGEIHVTVVDEKGTRESVIPPRKEHL